MEEKGVSKITVTQAPSKTTYMHGNTFDPTGMVVTATYADGRTADVTSLCTFSPSNIILGVQEVTITYVENGVTCTTAIPVIVQYNPSTGGGS